LKERYVVSLVVILLMMVFAINATPVRSDSSTPPLLPGAQIAPNAQMVNGPTAQALRWTKGQPYPVVNGKAVPPPDAPPSNAGSAPATSYGGHWYAGSVYSGTSKLNTWVISEISIPSTAASDKSEFYYVLLSIWDNAGSYDQIGFSGDYGVWGLTYSYTTGPCTNPTYVYTPDYFSLKAGQEYVLAISSQNTPYTHLQVYTVSSTGVLSLIFDIGAPTGVSNPGLEQEAFYCGAYDYTDYEEVYGTLSYTQPDPYGAPGGFQWYFHDNLNAPLNTGPWTFTKWTAWWTTNTPPTAVGSPAVIGSYSGYAELVIINNFQSTSGFIPG